MERAGDISGTIDVLRPGIQQQEIVVGHHLTSLELSPEQSIDRMYE